MGIAHRTAEELTGALEGRNWSAARAVLANGFEFYDPASPNPPMNADQWLGLNMGMAQAFSDFTYNFEIFDEEDDQVWVRVQMEGTHDGDWDLSAMGIGVIPATHLHAIAAPSVTMGLVNAAGKVERIEVIESEPDSGIVGLMQAIGVEIG